MGAVLLPWVRCYRHVHVGALWVCDRLGGQWVRMTVMATASCVHDSLLLITMLLISMTHR